MLMRHLIFTGLITAFIATFFCFPVSANNMGLPSMGLPGFATDPNTYGSPYNHTMHKDALQRNYDAQFGRHMPSNPHPFPYWYYGPRYEYVPIAPHSKIRYWCDRRWNTNHCNP